METLHTTQTAIQKQRKNSVFRRLAVLFFLIEAIVLVGVSALLYRYAHMQEEAEIETLHKTVIQGVEQLDGQIESAYQLTKNLVNDTRLAQIAYHMYPNEYEKSKLVLGILSSIRDICDLNPVIEDIKVSFPAENLDLSISNQYNKWANYQPPSESEMTLTDFLFIDDGVLKIRIAYPLSSRLLAQEPDYECEVTFSESFLRSCLTVFGSSEQSGAMLLLTGKDGNIVPIAEQDSSPAVTLLNEKLAQSGALSLPYISITGDRYTLSSEESAKYPIALVAYRNATFLSQNMQWIIIQITGVILVSSIFFLLMIGQTNKQVVRPLYQLMGAFEKVKERNLSTRIYHDRKDEFYFIYDAFNEMVQNMEQLIADIKEQHKLLQNAELMQLQAQIDPHFLYNSFNIIKYMADGEEYEQITEFVSALAKYYRFNNKETRQAIPLSAEVEHMETYVYIQQMRFVGRIHVEIGTLPAQVQDYLVPKLILQPLVENCYNHGLKNKLGDGLIRVSFALDGDRLTITVADNGEELTQDKLEKLQQRVADTDDASVSHALANIRRRLELAYEDSDMLKLSIGELGGLCAELTFDLKQTPLNLI